MAAPSGLLIAWVLVAFLSSHAASYVAHHGRLSAWWVAGYAVSLVVPIWSDCHTVAVAVALSLQGTMTSVILSGPPSILERLKPSENGKSSALNFALVVLAGLNYLVWFLSYVLTTPAQPTFYTVLGALTASLALFCIAEAVRYLQEKHDQKKSE